jgi:acyl-coenzyme A synthetase/AMP-(fatty) acid ligase
VPDEICLVDGFPRAATGKIRRSAVAPEPARDDVRRAA